MSIVQAIDKVKGINVINPVTDQYFSSLHFSLMEQCVENVRHLAVAC